MPSQSEIEQAVVQQLPGLADQTMSQLLAQVGQHNPALVNTSNGQIESVLPQGNTVQSFAEAGEQFFTTNNTFLQRVICRAKGDITDQITIANVTALVGIILAALSITVSVPLAAITLAVVILKIGIDEYCKGVTPTAQTA